MKKFVWLLVLLVTFAIGVGTAGGTFLKQKDNKVLSVQTQDNGSVTQPPANHADMVVGNPQRVRIPTIGVETAIEAVGNDTQGNMDVPKDYANTSWYQLGFRPGQKGNAVLAGHLDNKDGTPAVFWDIKKLKQGDEIFIVDEQGKELKFEVTETAQYPNRGFPINLVFGPAENAMLNLITCDGQWSSDSGYDKRFVVFSKLVEE